MTNASKTIVFFGTDDFSLVSLKKLVEADYGISAVVTKPDSKSGRGQHIHMTSVKKFALEKGIPVWQPAKISDINDNVRALGPNVAGVLVVFGKIIPSSTLELFNPGIINVHPSLLPLYRGPSPVESAIINDDKQTGVSIMKLTAGMDAGPVYGQKTHELSGHETRPELYNSLAQSGAKALLDLLPHILDGSLQPISQDDNKATYCQLISKSDAWLNANEVSAKRAERLVRAYLDFPRAKFNVLGGHSIIVTKSHVVAEPKSPLDILCNDGKYLSIDELIAPSGRTMTAQSFLNGYK